MTLDVAGQIDAWFHGAFQSLVDLERLYREVVVDGHRLFTLRKIRSALECVTRPDRIEQRPVPDDWRVERANWKRLVTALAGLLVAYDLVRHAKPNAIPPKAKRMVEQAFRSAIQGMAAAMPWDLAKADADAAVVECAKECSATILDEKDSGSEAAIVQAFVPVLDELFAGKVPTVSHV